MNDILITVEAGKPKRLLTAGKYCPQDIVVEAIGGVSGGLPGGYTRMGYIQFTGDQIIDTGIICTQDTKIRIAFTRDTDTAQYMYGVVNSGNTASVTAYLSSGGAWRFGNKSVSRNIIVNPDIVQSAIVDKAGIVHAGGTNSFSGTANFEAIGTLLIGACRSSNGAVGAAQFDGKIYAFEMWQDDAQVLHLIPAINPDGVYGFWDSVSEMFFESITSVPLTGGGI